MTLKPVVKALDFWRLFDVFVKITSIEELFKTSIGSY